MRISDWSSDVCSSDLILRRCRHHAIPRAKQPFFLIFDLSEEKLDFLQRSVRTPGRAPILDGALITRANKPKKLVRFIAIMLQFRLKRDHPSLLINGKIAMLGKLIEILLDLLQIGRASCRERVCQYV